MWGATRLSCRVLAPVFCNALCPGAKPLGARPGHATFWYFFVFVAFSIWLRPSQPWYVVVGALLATCLETSQSLELHRRISDLNVVRCTVSCFCYCQCMTRQTVQCKFCLHGWNHTRKKRSSSQGQGSQYIFEKFNLVCDHTVLEFVTLLTASTYQGRGWFAIERRLHSSDGIPEACHCAVTFCQVMAWERDWQFWGLFLMSFAK